MTLMSFSLEDLKKGCPGVTPDLGGFFAESGAVCLENQGHQREVNLKIYGDFQDSIKVTWHPATEQMLKAYNDLQDATENGAYGMAILLILNLTEYTILQKSIKGTGFDFWLGKKGQTNLLFQEKIRLEVSGILKGDQKKVDQRFKEKSNQTNRSDDSGLDAIIAIIEFSLPLSKLQKK